MSPIEDLQARADALLTRTEPSSAVDAKIASTEGPSRRFSPFLPSELDRALELAGELIRIADEQGGEAGVEAALAEAGRRAEVEDVRLVRHALEVFIVHHPEASRLAIPPLPRPPERAAARPAGVDEDEARIDWFREDVLANEHHRHWHVVYPSRGRPGPGGRPQLQDRQGELFFYMHEQMLARYDAERRAAGLGPVVPFADYGEPIAEGHDGRPAGTPLADVDRPDVGVLTIAELTEQRDRLLAAVESGSVEDPRGGSATVDSELLGALAEPTLGTLWRDVWHHGYGHVIAAFVLSPDGGGEPSDIGDTGTAIRDPFFWRWHRHIDDLNFALQERLAPEDFGDGPGVAVRGVDVVFEEDESVTSDELRTMVGRAPFDPDDPGAGEVEFADHESFLWHVHLDNPGEEERTVTVRIFLVPAEAAEDRRAWIEMDKFEHPAPPGASTLARAGSVASVVRKPATWPPVFVQGPAQSPHEQYCRCGWPYHLLIPRGTLAGMPFRVLVMLTDWELDQVAGDDECGSMSFCGARDRYPDRREMGYPFARPFGPEGIEATLGALPNTHLRDLTIRHDPRPPA